MRTGTDIVENSRFIQAINRNNCRLKKRLFTKEELTDDPSDLDLAIMFSAKESVAKALGTGFDSCLSWHDITIFLNQNQVIAKLHRQALKLASDESITLSVSQNHKTSITFALFSEGK